MICQKLMKSEDCGHKGVAKYFLLNEGKQWWRLRLFEITTNLEGEQSCLVVAYNHH